MSWGQIRAGVIDYAVFTNKAGIIETARGHGLYWGQNYGTGQMKGREQNMRGSKLGQGSKIRKRSKLRHGVIDYAGFTNEAEVLGRAEDLKHAYV